MRLRQTIPSQATIALLFAMFSSFACGVSQGIEISIAATPQLKWWQAGQSVSMEISISELPAGDSLESVYVSIEYDASLVQASNVVPGPIIPRPLNDPLDFYFSISPNHVDVTFLTFGRESADRIWQNGVAFMFTVTPLQSSTHGSIAFSSAEAVMFNVLDPESPFTPELRLGAELEFSVRPWPLGDTDFDGDVDLVDLNNVRNEFGNSGAAVIGDTNGDFWVDLIDLNAVRNSFGQRQTGISVEEPNNLLLLAVALTTLIGGFLFLRSWGPKEANAESFRSSSYCTALRLA